jgi:4-hydroxybenzoate polyprenyltransferase
MSILSCLYREIDIFFQFSWRDWSATIVPAGLFAAGSASALAKEIVLRNYLVVIIWMTIYLYSFNLLTQLMSFEEDALNKPDRPIPSGTVSRAQALRRCLIVWALFLLVPLYQRQIVVESLVHILFSYVLTFTKAGGHWFMKNIVAMTFMTWSYLSTTRKLMEYEPPETLHQTIAISIWAGIMVPSQDFRDQEGDKKVGRQTLPLAFGDRNARYLFAFAFVPLGFLILNIYNIAFNSHWILGAGHFLASYRILCFRKSNSDHKTYMVSAILNCIQ